MLHDAGAQDILAHVERWQAEGWTPPQGSGEPYDAFGTYWSESSKLGTGAAHWRARPLGPDRRDRRPDGGDPRRHRRRGGSISAIGDYAGEATARKRESAEKDEEDEGR